MIGAGPVGREIAFAALRGGYHTVLEDVLPEMLEADVAYIGQALDDAVARNALTPEQKARALANLSTARSVEDACRAADLLIEALADEMELKLEIFTLFDKFALPGAIFASHTSSLSIAEIAAITFQAENCIGMRFHRSAPNTETLEIVRARETSEETVAACVEVGRRMGKEVVVLEESTS